MERDTIQLNCANLEIEQAELSYCETFDDEEELQLMHSIDLSRQIHFCEETEVATLQCSSMLQTGNYELKYVFPGQINEEPKGFFRKMYKDARGAEKFVIMNNFEGKMSIPYQY